MITPERMRAVVFEAPGRFGVREVAAPVLLISIDGLRPGDLLDA